MKKRIATIVCLTLTITMLSACTNGNTGSDSKSTEDPKPTEEVKPTEVEEPTVTEETTPTEDPVPAKDEVVEFFWDEEIKEVDPEKLYSVGNYMRYVDMRETDECEFNLSDYQMHELADYGHSFEWSTEDSSMTIEIEMYLFFIPLSDTEEQLGVMLVRPGKAHLVLPFVPLMYNETKKCLVGYYSNGEGGYSLAEYYYDYVQDFEDDVTLNRKDVNPEVYGF